MNKEVNEAVNIILKYCENRECNICDFHDLTVYHDCKLMASMPCNWNVELKENE